MEKFAALIILDGQGIAAKNDANAVALANKPIFDNLIKNYPHNTLSASGSRVGLPDGQMGNSEVGHLNLGAGRVVWQSLSRINEAIKDGSFFKNEAFLKALSWVKENNSKLHLFGLAGSGGVHASSEHIIALYQLAKEHGLADKTYYHAFLDGRDTSPTSGLNFLKEIRASGLKIATVSGRYYAMDRDDNWDRLQKAIDNITIGSGKKYPNFEKGVKASYQNGVTDEFVIPFLVDSNGLVSEKDAIIFANFRPDRAIRISTAFSNPQMVKNYYRAGKATFDSSHIPKEIFFVSMMHYQETVKGEIAFQLQNLTDLYGDVIARNNLAQLRIAETEKYAHVTFFFDGGYEKDLPKAKRILIPSPKVATYDLKPEMSAYEVADAAIKEILTKKYATMILNFANPDMVGHTGSIPATIKAVEAVDYNLGRVLEAIEKINGVAVILADHGNAEMMRDSNGDLHTAHTTNLVPIIITKKGITIKDDGALCDIAPTLLDLLNIEKPTAMTGTSLIKKP
ncbi:MAG: 2,3-bisphosphoglycerate-independent phosphoglycerate mutase [Acholeplasmataceae bacterium]|jgi:2,3-bisphosphoglycerate-independent phosphoglycerate mutase|nr:2,3-bisphosphoglycerate-independent phosphoglycerate mutase [Acholeplasmataceae bacterium]HHT39658.1 2,3-bisphosphoglycerate-independent phosphoglycerate mutase [Acholeplasmataceae bacterium]